MSDDQKDVVIAAYLFEDLARTGLRRACVKLAEEKTITVEGVVLVTEGRRRRGDRERDRRPPGPKGRKLGGGVGLVVGLFAPPLLAATAVGAAAGAVMGKFAKHRVESGIARQDGRALPPGSGGVIAVYDSRTAPTPSTRRSPTRSRNPSRRSTGRAPRSSRRAWPRLKPGWVDED